VRTVSVRLMADVSNFHRGIQTASTDVKGLVKELEHADKKGNLDHLTGAATGLGVGLLGAAAVAVKFSMDFEKQMSSVKAATHASSAEIDALRKASMQAGKDTQFSATEAAKGVEELAKAGVSTSDILGGGLKGALSLAAAGELDVGQAAEAAASALTQFKLKGQDVPHVADLLAAAAGKAQGSVADMSAALNQSGLIAAQTGLSIEDTTGTLAAFANAGLIGSDAGTSFKTMLQALQAPSGKTKELMDDLGISAYDVQGNFIGITALAGQLKTQLSKLTPELRANALAQIFGSDATRAASILYEQGAEGVQTWIDKTNDAGYAAETAAIKTDNLAGDLERLKGSLETQAIQAGGGLNEGLRVLTKSADALVGTLGALPPAVTGTLAAMSAVGGALLLAGVAWVKARTAIAATVVELNAVGPAGAKAAVGLQAASKWAGRAAVAFIGLEVAGAVFDQLGNSAVNVDKLTAALQDYATTGKMTQGITDEFGANLDDLSLIAGSAEAATHGFWKQLNDLTSAVPGVSSVVDSMNESLTGTSFNDATARMQALDESFTAFIGTQKDARKAGELWNEILLKSGLDTQQLQTLLPQASAAMTELQKTSHGASGAQGQLAATTGKTTEQLEKEKEAAQALSKAFDDLFDQYMSADQAAMEYQDALQATNKELKSGSKSLSVNTEAGRKNRSSVLDLIKSIKDQRDANIRNGMSVDAADKKYRTQIGTLGKTMEKLGFTRKEVEKLIGKYKDVPNKVGTSIETPGLPKSRDGIKGYQSQLDKLTRQIKTHVSVEGDAAAYRKLVRLLVAQQAAKKGISVSAAQSAFNKNAYAAGGWTGPGSKHDEAGIVHADEFVIKKESRRKIEQQSPGLLDEMNATGQVRGYANGGMVMPFRVNASMTKIMSMAEAMSKVTPQFSKNWPSSPSAQRGDSGVWRDVVRLIKSTGPVSGSFGNAYRPGDPLWHGSGRAVDWMGYNQDALATFLSRQRPLELIHRTNKRDYAYTRGVNKGSFRNSLMQAHRNHVHIAMGNGGVIGEHILGVGASGTSYEFGEGGQPETVTPGIAQTPTAGGNGRTTFNYVTVSPVININGANQSPQQIAMAVNREIGAQFNQLVRGIS
jgi:TP901 family phage tail tape measure protein